MGSVPAILTAVLLAVGTGLAGTSLWTAEELGPLRLAGVALGLLLAALGVATAVAPSRRLLARFLRTRVFLVACSVAASLALAEAALRLTIDVPPGQSAFSREMRALTGLPSDPRLLHRMPPGSPGHDAWGYRNDAVPERAEIVAIGDSWTWGFNAERTKAWPQQLARMTGTTVYNMAVGGYGPGQYALLAEDALKLRPRTVVVGLFLGNDVLDAFNFALKSPLFPELRASIPPEEDASFSRLYEVLGSNKAAATNWQGERMAVLARSGLGVAALANRWSAVARLLARAGLLPGQSLEDLHWQAVVDWSRQDPGDTLICGAGATATALVLRERAIMLDPSQPAVRSGLRLAETFLGRARKNLADAGVTLKVAVFPTKEWAYGRTCTSDAAYAKLVADEDQMGQAVMAALARQGIEAIDLRGAFRDAVEHGVPVFSRSEDSHPSATGYGLIAERVAAALRRSGG